MKASPMPADGLAKTKKSALRRRTDGPTENLAESPIGWLYRRRDKDGRPLISEAEFNAGERLRADYSLGQLTARVTSNWSASGVSSGRRTAPGAGVELSDAVIAARERVNHALKAVGPELASVLVDVCCHLKGLETAEREAGWPQRSGKVVLTLALTRLARHYGYLTDTGGGGSGGPRIRHWGAEDYRPLAGD